MNEQRQHAARQHTAGAGSEAPQQAAAAERLAASRERLGRIYAAADGILDQIDFADNTRFLEQVRQSGGQ